MAPPQVNKPSLPALYDQTGKAIDYPPVVAAAPVRYTEEEAKAKAARKGLSGNLSDARQPLGKCNH